MDVFELGEGMVKLVTAADVAGAAVGRATSLNRFVPVVGTVVETVPFACNELRSILITGTRVGSEAWSTVVVVWLFMLFCAFALTRSLFANRFQTPSVPAIELTAIMYLKAFGTNCFL